MEGAMKVFMGIIILAIAIAVIVVVFPSDQYEYSYDGTTQIRTDKSTGDAMFRSSNKSPWLSQRDFEFQQRMERGVDARIKMNILTHD